MREPPVLDASNAPIYVVGDVHGHRRQLEALLAAAGLLRDRNRWAGGDATLVLLGDLVDRGPGWSRGPRSGHVDQSQARDHGGHVHAVLGDHEVLLLAARRFGARASGGPGGIFQGDWLANGGVASDLERLSAVHER